MEHKRAIRGSMVWAAYGDALGFITELTDIQGLRWRTGRDEVVDLLPWRRVLGGRFGFTVRLPVGCYSDDTQLRLATCRAMSDRARFDVEAFSKVELTSWRAYGLGAGIATKAAARSLTTGKEWYCNFFAVGQSNYFRSGGSGAAMRIQPHVLGRISDRNAEGTVIDIIKNCITTHGHPTAIVGALFHGIALRQTILNGLQLNARQWFDVLDELQVCAAMVNKDEYLSTLWLPSWESLSGRSFSAAFLDSVEILRRALEFARSLTDGPRMSCDQAYNEIVAGLGAQSEETRGSGITCAVLASVAALISEGNCLSGIRLAANTLGTDTDTISSMAGALSGSTSADEPPTPPMDLPYILEAADRLVAMQNRKPPAPFAYPDLLYWKAASAEVDSVQLVGDRWELSGLGEARPTSEIITHNKNDGIVMQWFEFTFGQNVLVKRRHPPRSSIAPLFVERKEMATPFELRTTINPISPDTPKISLDQATSEAISANFDAKVVGQLLTRLVDQEGSIEIAVSFAAIIAKARLARSRKRSS